MAQLCPAIAAASLNTYRQQALDKRQGQQYKASVDGDAHNGG
jgi:hypothetical protein